MKIHHWTLIVVAVLTGDVAAAQLYLPVPPTTGENTWQLILTNVAPSPAAFKRTIFSPGQVPSAQGVTGLYPFQTSIAAEQGESAAHLEIIDPLKPGISVSSRLVDQQDHASRLPVLKASNIVARGKPVTFQFWPAIAPLESATIVVFSPAKIESTCSVALNSNIGRISSTSLTVPAASQIATVEVSAAAQVDFVRIVCNRPVLAFSYRAGSGGLEFIAPANSE
ncbi:MAG TPA: hypothetical protein VF173_14090 [Thermoanaerobaculia bacterium]|nr:hypothetical protein [Thermoanaerobaculia bacterium]